MLKVLWHIMANEKRERERVDHLWHCYARFKIRKQKCYGIYRPSKRKLTVYGTSRPWFLFSCLLSFCFSFSLLSSFSFLIYFCLHFRFHFLSFFMFVFISVFAFIFIFVFVFAFFHFCFCSLFFIFKIYCGGSRSPYIWIVLEILLTHSLQDKNFFLIGYFNAEESDTTIKDFCDIYSFKNLINEATCFKNSEKPKYI